MDKNMWRRPRREAVDKEVECMAGKDRVSVVYDVDLGAIAANWVDGAIVSTGGDVSPLYPVKTSTCVPLAVYLAYSHFSDEVRMPAIEWLLQHDAVLEPRLQQELNDWYKGIGEIP